MVISRFAPLIRSMSISAFGRRGVPPAATLKVIIWPPAEKIRNDSGELIHVTPMTAIEAKRLMAVANNVRRRGIDVYGHAAAEFRVDLKNHNISPEITRTVKDHVGIDINVDTLQSVYAYISWYPKWSREGAGGGGIVSTGRTLSKHDQKEFMDQLHIEEENPDVQMVKQRALDFLGAEYKAENGNPEDDLFQYGPPFPTNVFSLKDLNFNAILISCFQMMKYCISEDGILTMEETAPAGTYYGLDMLRKCRELLKDERLEPIAPEHVCTTAVIRLLEAGVGRENYLKIAREVIRV